MNTYFVKGILRWLATEECECCGQDMETEHITPLSFYMEASDEDAARAENLIEAREILMQRYPKSNIDDAEWTKVSLREIGEAEMMKRINAPTLF